MNTWHQILSTVWANARCTIAGFYFKQFAYWGKKKTIDICLEIIQEARGVMSDEVKYHFPALDSYCRYLSPLLNLGQNILCTVLIS